MLEALAFRKDGGLFNTAAVGQFESDARMKRREDFVTSAVFGPLRFLPTHAVWGFVKRMFLAPGAVDEDGPQSHLVEFWPSLRCSGRRVEPDILLIFLGNGGAPFCVVCIEAKWDWRPSDGELQKQVSDQRRAVCKRYPEYSRIYNVLISRLIHHVDVEGVNCVTWGGICACPPISGGAAWQGMVKQALLRLGESPVPPFVGFRMSDSLRELEVVLQLAGSVGEGGGFSCDIFSRSGDFLPSFDFMQSM